MSPTYGCTVAEGGTSCDSNCSSYTGCDCDEGFVEPPAPPSIPSPPFSQDCDSGSCITCNLPYWMLPPGTPSGTSIGVTCMGNDGCDCDDGTQCDQCDDSCGCQMCDTCPGGVSSPCTLSQGGTSCDSQCTGPSPCAPADGGTSCDSSCDGPQTSSCDCDSGIWGRIPPSPPPLPRGPDDAYCNMQCGISQGNPNGWCSCDGGVGVSCDCNSVTEGEGSREYCAVPCSGACDCDDSTSCDQCDDNCPGSGGGCAPADGGTSCDSGCDGNVYSSCDCDEGYPPNTFTAWTGGDVIHTYYSTGDCSGTPQGTQTFTTTCTALTAATNSFHGVTGFYVAVASQPTDTSLSMVVISAEGSLSQCESTLPTVRTSGEGANQMDVCQTNCGAGSGSCTWALASGSSPGSSPAAAPAAPAPASVVYTLAASGAVEDYTASVLDTIAAAVAAQLTGVSASQVTVTVAAAGGGIGRRLQSSSGVTITITIATDTTAAAAIESTLAPTSGSTAAATTLATTILSGVTLASTGGAPTVTSVAVATPSAASSSDDDVPIGAIIGGAAGGVLIIVVIVYFACIRNRGGKSASV